jgi:hypothetical protein
VQTRAVFDSLLVPGILLTAAAALLAIADSGGLASRMPTQVVPRRFARYPLAIGLVLVVIGAVGAFLP